MSSVSTWNVANAFTVVRVLLVPVFAWVLLGSERTDETARVVAFGVFALASTTDQLDGLLARRHGLVTDFGKLADPIADKALVGTALVGLSLLGELPWWVTAVIMGREVGITLLRFWVIRYGIIAASPGGKLKTLLQTAAIGLYLLPLSGVGVTIAEAVMGLAVVVTVATGLDYVVRAWRLRAAST